MGQLDHRDEVLVDGVDPAWADEAHEVEASRRARATRTQASFSAALSKNEPSAMAALIRGRSWRTRNPAPRLRCPTSLLPICPAGRPTASPDASSLLCGHSASSRFQFHIGAASSALRDGSSFMPEPVEHDEDDGHAADGGRCGADDRREDVRLQRRAADQGAVDVRLGEELGGVRIGHAAAVLDRDLVGGRRVELAERGRGSGPPPPGRRSPVAASPVPIAHTGS